MKILGVSLGTIILVAVVVIVVRKYGNSIPLVNSIG